MDLNFHVGKPARITLLLLCGILLMSLSGCVTAKYSQMDVQMDLPGNFISKGTPLIAPSTTHHDLEELKFEANKILVPLGFSLVPPGPSQSVDSGQYEVAEWHLQTPSNWFWGSRSYDVDMMNLDRVVTFTVNTDEMGSENEIRKVTTALAAMMQEKFPNHPFKVSFHRVTTAMPP